MLRQYIPTATTAQPEETVHLYALHFVERAIKKKQPTDYGSMKNYYLQAVEGKYRSQIDRIEILNLKNFLEVEKTAILTVWLRRFDSNQNGKIEKNEWGGNNFSFVSLDSNQDGSIDTDEYWLVTSEDIRKEFLDSDLDGNAELSLDEYIKLKGGEEAAGKFAEDFDLDRNNNISESELNAAKHIYGYF